MVDIVVWIVFGAISGWIATLIAQNDTPFGVVSNILIGILGAMLGGFIVRALIGAGIPGVNISGLFISIVGAIIFLFGFRRLHRG